MLYGATQQVDNPAIDTKDCLNTNQVRYELIWLFNIVDEDVNVSIRI